MRSVPPSSAQAESAANVLKNMQDEVRIRRKRIAHPRAQHHEEINRSIPSYQNCRIAGCLRHDAWYRLALWPKTKYEQTVPLPHDDGLRFYAVVLLFGRPDCSRSGCDAIQRIVCRFFDGRIIIVPQCFEISFCGDRCGTDVAKRLGCQRADFEGFMRQ